ncbi:MAG: GGDEF domain-containing protein [Lachnospiraceae bacterium]|nr:GGDEF domain-containing protein [Lachnospiraceae bacterium]
MPEYAILYLEINLFSLALIGIILYKTNGLSKMVAQRNFVMSIVAEMVFFASDTLYVMIDAGALSFGTPDNIAKLLCKTIYFFSTSMMCFFWFIYFEHLRGTAFVREKKTVRIASSILWVIGVLLVINLFSGILFYVDPDGGYHRGPFFILTYVISYTYVLIAFIRTAGNLLDKNDSGDKRKLLPLVLFPLAPAAAGILQFVYPRLPVACGVLSLTTLVLYLNWIDQLISLDPLTGLNNRKQISHFYDQWVRNHGEGDIINVLMIDADKFKSINDTYGHIQGDKALINISEALKLGSRSLPKRANIARYGGDEFAVMFESGDPEDAVRLKENITQKLDMINKRTGIPFELTVSIGIASSDGSCSLKELIDRADEDMYEAKKASRA